MIRIFNLFVFLLACVHIDAQRLSIIDALHLNEELDYRAGRPVRIVEHNIHYSITRTEIRDKIIKTFDPAGLLLTYEYYGDEEQLFARISYTNDTINRVKLSRVMEIWRQNGFSKETCRLFYDSSMFLTGYIDQDSNNNVIRKAKIVCNEKGHPVELSLFDSKDTCIAKEKAAYFYSSNKVIRTIELSEVTVINNQDSAKISLKNESAYPSDDGVFNSRGDKIKWNGWRNLEKDMYYEREFTYDDFGNWIESKTYLVRVQSNGELYKEPKSIISREITYE